MAINDVECCDFYQVHENVVKAVNDKMPDEDKLYDLAEIFKVFGDSTRIKILYVLFEAEMCGGLGWVQGRCLKLHGEKSEQPL